MHLRYGDLVQLIGRVHALPGSRSGATESRIKNLSRIGFPPAERVGSGERAEYGAEQVVQLLVAFELLRHRVPPATIAEIVRTEWTRIAAAFAAAARALLEPGARRLAPAGEFGSRPLLLVDSLGLHDIGTTVNRGELLTTVEPTDATELFGAAAGEWRPRSALVLDPGAIVAEVAAQTPWLRRSRPGEEWLRAVAAIAAEPEPATGSPEDGDAAHGRESR